MLNHGLKSRIRQELRQMFRQILQKRSSMHKVLPALFVLSDEKFALVLCARFAFRQFVVRPKGLEPLAHCLEGSCSIHLSYGRK